MISFIDFFNARIKQGLPIFFDGGMGTMIQAAQAKDSSIVFSHPEELVFTRPDVINNIHCAYIEAGAHLITTNTFGANPIKMDGCTFCATDTVSAAVSLVKEAIKKSGKTAFTALDFGPTGTLLEPLGALSFDDAYACYKAVAEAGEMAGADLAIIETISDLYEARAAILAIKENTLLPIFVSMTFQDSSSSCPRTLTGADVLTCVTYLEALGVNAVGFNCGGTLDDAFLLTKDFVRYASVPIIVQPNAGIPEEHYGKTIFSVTAQDFALAQLRHYQEGAVILGGCCGTTPLHIAALIFETQNREKNEITQIAEQTSQKRLQNAQAVRVCSYSKTVSLDEPVIIGERINPTGKPKCKEALRQGNLHYLVDEAAAQIEAGAHILDVNTGLPDIDEGAVMLAAVRVLQKTFSVPLQIDSSDPAVLEKTLRYYNGKAFINSVSGKKESMDAVFPTVKKYGGLVIALALDESGIPQTAEGRLNVVRNIVSEAAQYGIPKNHLIADALTLTVSSRQEDAHETLRALTLIKSELGLKTVLGVSNISFGLPAREMLNAHFLTAALFAGLDACIINPLSKPLRDAFYCCRVLNAHDKNCLDYIAQYAGEQNANELQKIPLKNQKVNKNEQNSELHDILLHGFTEKATQAAQCALLDKTPQQIIDLCIVPALDEAGKRYETGRYFLPQLLLCADCASKIFEVLKVELQKTGTERQNKGTVLIATVYGDVHDIGKNIVRAMLENYGYTVIDLGKNVSPDSIVQNVLKFNVQLVGLSALMTTTVVHMRKTIELLRESEKKTGKKIVIMVGGAVLTEHYAQKIGADYYAKDALAAVSTAKQVFGK